MNVTCGTRDHTKKAPPKTYTYQKNKHDKDEKRRRRRKGKLRKNLVRDLIAFMWSNHNNGAEVEESGQELF
jgi:hypothetical protein